MTLRALVVDHRDSFAFILGDQFARAGASVTTIRSDVSLEEFGPYVTALAPSLVVLSPGPGTPRQTGVTLPWLATDPRTPILGVCLGHQALAHDAGGVVDQTPRPAHGEACDLVADEPAPEANPLAQAFATCLTNGMRAARYHSLHVTTPGPRMRVLARTRDESRTVMAIAHEARPRLGLQFHPESILTPFGASLIAQILAAATPQAIYES